MDLNTVDHLLTTTRSVRKRLDFSRPVERSVITRCIELALQAPTGGNAQGWSFMVVTDEAKRAAISALYKKAFKLYSSDPNMRARYGDDGDLRAQQLDRVLSSADYLSDNMHKAPALVIACIEGRVEKGSPLEQAGVYGSILPAAWSFMLALRSRGLGTTWTTLHIMYEQEAAKITGIPNTITQAALFPVAYYTGDDFKPAKRLPPSNSCIGTAGVPRAERNAATHWPRRMRALVRVMKFFMVALASRDHTRGWSRIPVKTSGACRAAPRCPDTPRPAAESGARWPAPTPRPGRPTPS